MKKLALVSLLLASTANAQTPFTAQLCWTPLTNPDVQGYNVYVSDAGVPFVAGVIDAGLPTLNAAGNMQFQALVDSATTNSLTFKVAAYGTTAGTFWEGPQSNSLDINCATAEVVTGKQVCPPTCLRGDITCDGMVTLVDVLALLRVVSGLQPVPGCGP